MPRKFEFLSPGIQITEIDLSINTTESIEEGPIIIGRTRKGPAMQPVRVKNMEDFFTIFGTPVAGGAGPLGDAWRDGPNVAAPTYASYAAQSWLASENSPVTVVRLLGDQSGINASGNGIAGWQVQNSKPSTTIGDNGTAYGLFIIDSGSASGNNHATLADVMTVTDETSTFTINVPTAQGGEDGSVIIAVNTTNDVGADYDGANTIGIGAQTADAAGVAARIVAAINNDTTALAGFGASVALAPSGRGQAGVPGVRAAIGSSPTKITLTAECGGTTGNSIVVANAGGVDFGGGTLAGGSDPVFKTGSLAAVLYCDSGYLQLSGNLASDGTTAYAGAATLLQSIGEGIMFGLDVYNSSGVKVGSTKKFNFSRNSSQYIRNVLNTNPQLVNSTMNPTDTKTYWLGETFERSLKSKVVTSTAGAQYGVLLPIHQSDSVSTAASNWGYHRAKHSTAKSGWIISHDNAGDNTAFDAKSAKKLFRICSLHSGNEIQSEIMIAIDNIRLPSNQNINSFGSFSLSVMDTAGNVLEKFTNLNLDPLSPNYVLTKIGDDYLSWDETNQKFENNGSEPNHSDYIRIEMYNEAREIDYSDIPFGFLGPGRPKSFALVSGSTTVKAGSDHTSGFTKAMVVGSGSVAGAERLNEDTSFVMGTPCQWSGSFEFPSLQLRDSGSSGFVSNPYKAYFGIRPKISDSSTIHDVDFCDYVRALPSGFDSMHHNPSDNFEHSFAFSLDDIVIDEAADTVTYSAGSRAAGNSYTAKSGSAKLLNKKVRQFVMPIFGGRHGLDIKEMEPFRNSLITSLGTDESSNYLRFTLDKAIKAIKDPEFVPGNLLIAPGITNTSITDKIIAQADTRQDVLAIIDLEGDYVSKYESTDDMATRRGSVSTVVDNIKTRGLDSTFACTFYPAVQIIDKRNNNQRVWIPSSVAGLGGIAQSEAASAAWFAPAGFNRGGLGNLGGVSGPTVVQARQRIDSDERDDLYVENINPIASFPNEGVVIFGQKTLQGSVDSALGRINVRRLLIYLKAKISAVARNILFDNSVKATWTRFISQAEPILADVQARFGLTEYKLVLDETTTTADLIDKNILYAQVYLKPARAIEYIAIDFIVTKTGASFA